MKSHRLFAFLRHGAGLIVATAAFGMFCPTGESRIIIKLPRRYTFKIEPATPLADLLPAPPRTPLALPPYLNDDLTKVAEVTFGAPVDRQSHTEKETAHIVAKINHLNQKDPDGFLKALLANRPDLRGLPFVMGDACRTDMKQAQLFAEVVQVVHGLQVLPKSLAELEYVERLASDKPLPRRLIDQEPAAERYWKELRELLARTNVDGNTYRVTSAHDDVRRAKVAALMQMFAPASEHYRVALAGRLAAIQHVDATHALAKVALHAPEDSVRAAAIRGLQTRAPGEYTDILMQGFRYPLPAVSKRAADALVKLERKDLLAELVNVLEQPDPRAPVPAKIDGKEVSVVRELVRVNHHRNCLLCHAPGNSKDVAPGVLTAPVPLPDLALGSESPGGGYSFGSSPDIFVRVDVTYLRQDFSLMMSVENARPWPEMQRFDFLVRTRVLSAAEAATCGEQVAQETPPNHVAAQYALRELAGRTPLETTPQGWRRWLNEPQTQSSRSNGIN